MPVKLIGFGRQRTYEMPSYKGTYPNRFARKIEQTILEYSLTRLTLRPVGAPQEMTFQGVIQY